mmetsp:Transcript_117870/g.340720  ORF Transcript_117870/g.340720 Transcript_117870/m.340720 type:complete len:786 (+) Transcript_117870:92-2449(+)
MALARGAALALVLAAQGAPALEVSAASGQRAGQRQLALEREWSQELRTPKKYKSPVQRVRMLLQKMKDELDAEASKEAEMYDKMVCWCETNEKEKKQAVADADAKDAELGAEIEARSARFGTLSAEIANTKEEIAANTEALKQARALREDEASKFRGEEKDMVQVVANLRNAIAVLSKHQKTQALLQLDGPVLSGMRVLLRDVALKYEELVAGRQERAMGSRKATALLALSARSDDRLAGGSADAKALLEALDVHGARVSQDLPLKFAERLVAEAASGSARGRSFLQVADKQPLYESRSAARSSGIYGVLTQMLEEFEAELSTSQKEELSAQESFKALSAAKEAEIEAGKKKLDEMQAEDAGNAKALSDAKEDLSLTREQRSADIKFLQNLKLQCNDLDKQWEKRSQTRAAETQAVAEAITILTEDDNRETLHRSVTLLQEASSVVADASVARRRSNAAAFLRRASSSPDFEADDLLAAWRGRSSSVGRSSSGPRARLSTLAMAVSLDSFTKVKEMIDKMHAELKEQQAEEAKFKAYCQKELKDNEKTTYKKSELKKDLEARMDELESLMARLAEEIQSHKDQLATTQVEIKKAGQQREAENSDFQQVVADQRAMQTILQKALAKLKDFYEKKIGDKTALVQASQEPPVKFNAYKTNAGSNSVIGLIEQIVEDSVKLEKEATAAEYKAQTDYEEFVKSSNGVIKSLQDAVVEKSDAIAGAKTDAAQAGSDHESTVDELEALNQFKADLHNQCDFVMKNFGVRQRARQQEIEAIQNAKAILSGADQ